MADRAFYCVLKHMYFRGCWSPELLKMNGALDITIDIAFLQLLDLVVCLSYPRSSIIIIIVHVILIYCEAAERVRIAFHERNENGFGLAKNCFTHFTIDGLYNYSFLLHKSHLPHQPFHMWVAPVLTAGKRN